MKPKNENELYKRYLTTYVGTHLEHSLDKFGTWKVLGEDPNCDMGGPHVEPHLATIEGTLSDVIRKGVMMDYFWAWGGGGRFVLIDIETITPKDKKARIANLKDIIAKAAAELKALEA